MISSESELDRIINDICRDDSDLRLTDKRRGLESVTSSKCSTESTQKAPHKR